MAPVQPGHLLHPAPRSDLAQAQMLSLTAAPQEHPRIPTIVLETTYSCNHPLQYNLSLRMDETFANLQIIEGERNAGTTVVSPRH